MWSRRRISGRPSGNVDHVWVVALVLSLRNVIAGQSCPTITDCSPEGTLPCIVHNSSYCRTHIREYSRPQGQLSWPGRPRDFVVEPVEKQCGGSTKSGLAFQWKPPLDGSLHHLRGFQLTVRPLGGPLRGRPPICRLFDLRNATWTLFDVDVIFTFTLMPLPDNTQFSVMLFSLPLPEVQHQPEMGHHMIVYIASRESWSSQIAWTLEDSNITVAFELAPRSIKIHEYKVILVEKNTGLHQTQLFQVDESHSKTRRTTFSNLMSGLYEIQVLPLGGKCLADCVVTISDLIRVSGDRRSNTSYGENEGYLSAQLTSISGASRDTLTVLASVLGAVLVLGLLTSVGIAHRSGVWKARRPACIESSARQPGVEEPLTGDGDLVAPSVRKAVLFIYLPETEEQTTLVHKFSLYLHTFYFCDVLQFDWSTADFTLQDTQSYIRSTLNWVDVITIIHAGDTLKHSNLRTTTTPELSKNHNFVSNVISLIHGDQSLTMKCAEVNFNSVQSDSLFHRDCKRHFSLMSDFTDFLRFLHKLKEAKHFEDYSKTTEGRDLLRSIEKASSRKRNFQEPDEFPEDFVEPSDVSDCECDDISVSGRLRDINLMCMATIPK